MNCTACGSPVKDGDSYCTACGASIQTEQMPGVSPPPPAEGSWASTPAQPAYPPASGLTSGKQPTTGAQPIPGTPPQAFGQPSPIQSGEAARKKGLSGGAIAGIIVGVMVLLIAIVIAGFFGIRALIPAEKSKAPYVTETPLPVEQPPAEATEQQTDDASDPSEPGDDGSATNGGSAAESDDELITDEQARETVKGFLDARLKKDVEASREFCSNNYWNGEDHDLLTDRYWRPDSYEIVNSEPDLMYVHVVVMTRWPSGDEYMIWSCVKDPGTGRPVIDGKLDPQNVPELLP